MGQVRDNGRTRGEKPGQRVNLRQFGELPFLVAAVWYLNQNSPSRSVGTLIQQTWHVLCDTNYCQLTPMPDLIINCRA
jgi:hypothetical protein